MNLLIMTLAAVMVGLTTMGALTWAYFAEDRACRSKATASAESPDSAVREERERIDA